MAKQNRKISRKGTIEPLGSGGRRIRAPQTSLGGEAEYIESENYRLVSTSVSLMTTYELSGVLSKAKEEANAVLRKNIGIHWKRLQVKLSKRLFYLSTGIVRKRQPAKWLKELRERLSESELAQVREALEVLDWASRAENNDAWDWIAFGRVWQLMLDRSHEGDIERGAKVLDAATKGGRNKRKLSDERCAVVVQELQSAQKVVNKVEQLARRFGVCTNTIWRCWRKNRPS